MNTSLKARLTGPNWIDELLWDLQGDSNSSQTRFTHLSAELGFGDPLTVPEKKYRDKYYPKVTSDYLPPLLPDHIVK